MILKFMYFRIYLAFYGTAMIYFQITMVFVVSYK